MKGKTGIFASLARDRWGKPLSKSSLHLYGNIYNPYLSRQLHTRVCVCVYFSLNSITVVIWNIQISIQSFFIRSHSVLLWMSLARSTACRTLGYSVLHNGDPPAAYQSSLSNSDLFVPGSCWAFLQWISGIFCAGVSSGIHCTWPNIDILKLCRPLFIVEWFCASCTVPCYRFFN